MGQTIVNAFIAFYKNEVTLASLGVFIVHVASNKEFILYKSYLTNTRAGVKAKV